MEPETIVCTSCLHQNDEIRKFCEECGAPIGAFTTTMPFERIQAEGFAYREASSNPSKPIVIFGMYLIFMPWLIGAWSMAGYSFYYYDYLWGAIFFVLGLFAFLMLLKTTKNYIKNKREKQVEPAD